MIAIVGDRNPHYLTHEATDVALSRLGAEARWVSTPTLLQDPGRLSEYAGALIAPGSPYLSTEGALAAIRYARELGLPLLGTCGGFQHVILEFARDVAGMTGADHAELNADADVLVVVPLSCSLVGQQHPVEIRPGTLAGDLYAATEFGRALLLQLRVELAVSRSPGDGWAPLQRLRSRRRASHPRATGTPLLPRHALRPPDGHR